MSQIFFHHLPTFTFNGFFLFKNVIHNRTYYRMIWLWLLLLCTLVTAQDPALLKEYARANNASLLWGPYRSNLYFGIRPRGLPKSLLNGLMWYNSDTFLGLQDIRHSCEQGDDMNGFGWNNYDPRLGGTQTIRDRKNNIEITTEFVKTDDGNWAARIKGKPDSENQKTSLVWYSALEGRGELNLQSKLTDKGIDGAVKLKGSTPDLGDFTIDVTRGPKSNKHPIAKGHSLEKSKPADKTHYAALTVADDNSWMTKDIFVTLAQEQVQKLGEQFKSDEDMPAPHIYFLSDSTEQLNGRMHLIQKAFTGSFEFDILYNTKGATPITSEKIDGMLEGIVDTIDKKFANSFHLQPPFDTEEHVKFAKEFYSNLIGGLNYFHGQQLVDRGEHEDEDEEEFWKIETEIKSVEEGPYELMTLVPSRSFFPRGFYWDEGFHLLPVLEYDPDIVLEIIKSWLNLVDDDGWIAREQILGPESRSKVPPEFQTQFPDVANPPTLMLLLSGITKKVHNSEMLPKMFDNNEGDQIPFLGDAHIKTPDLLLGYVRKIYPLLQTHYDWFRNTQRGNIKEWDREAFSMREGYRWRKRTPDHCLASGLDDYPRAVTPHTGELHVDLISWIGMFTRAMKDFAQVLGEEDDMEEYARIEQAIVNNIEDLHWDEKEQTYCDATIDEYDEDVHVCHKGYVSLFPFLLKLIPDDKIDDRVIPLLETIADPEQLWTEFGIRSLSKSDENYGTKENYWRGPIWMNLNYMILDSLQYYAQQSNRVRDRAAPIYAALRENVVRNVKQQWEETGFAWEQYNAETGKGQGVRHFLGWTALTVNIMGMPESL